MNIALDQFDVKKIAQKDVILITPDNKDELYKSINSRKPSYYMIYYQTSNKKGQRYGHWCGLIIHPEIRQIWFFDSYGGFPDDQLEHIDDDHRVVSNQINRDVGEFLYSMTRRRYKIRYNERCIQQLDKNISTCGRYIGLWIKKDIQPEKFVDWLLDLSNSVQQNTDEIITIITNILL